MPKLINSATREIILPNLDLAESYWRRFRGLMFRKKLPPGFGIWIRPCKSIHTMWMRTSIDVYFIDAKGTVIQQRKNIRPWRIVLAPKPTHSVLETPAGAVEIPLHSRVEWA